MDPQPDDLRHMELETLEAIYPEIRRPNEAKDTDPFTFEIELPVRPAAPVTVFFPAATGNDTVTGPDASVQPAEDSLEVSYLPALILRISLPEDYPEDNPPEVQISTDPPWLPRGTLSKLECDGPRLWEEMGRDMVAYTYIDHVQREADDVFGSISPEGTLEIASQHKLAVLDYDIKAKKEAFDKETFDCGICLDPKKGTKCHKMLDCGHIFCKQCLQDFYNDAIEEGNVTAVRCLTFGCAKDRAAKLAKDGKKGGKSKTSITPSELLQIGLSEDTVKRYVMLKYKTQLESDKNTVYCPRQWCNGAARSEKHKKPSGLEFEEASDPESEGEKEDELAEKPEKDTKKKTKRFDPNDLLAVCTDCKLSFCSRCLQTWHGEFVLCAPKRDKEELTEEEKASLEYVRMHTSPCPTCSAPAQKTHGCNHMICFRCETHFCYLCSAWLDPVNPYQHYNQMPGGKVTSCYMRLWELEGGDGDDIGLGYIGGGGPAPVANRAPPEEAAWEIEDDIEEEPVPRNDERRPNQHLDENGRPIAVAREAPLVLRLMDNQPNGGRAAAPAPDPVPAPRAPPPDRGQHPPQRGRGAPAANQRGNAGRGRGGRGGRAPRGRGGRGANERAVGAPGRDAMNVGDAGLDAAQEAWVRNFVQMALLDVEDEIDDDMDDNDELFRIR